MKLTYRDKILLIGAVVVIIWAIGIFLIIKPAFTTMNETSKTKDSKDNEVITLEERVDQEKNLKDDLQKAYDTAVEHTNEYFYKLDTKESVTDTIRELLYTSKREVVNTDYSIDDLSLTTVTPYTYTTEQILSVLAEQAHTVENSGVEDTDTAAAVTSSLVANTVYTYSVDSDFECSLDDLYDFADSLLSTDQQSFILQSCEIDDIHEDKVTGKLSFNYYMAPEIPKPAALKDSKDDSKDSSEDK